MKIRTQLLVLLAGVTLLPVATVGVVAYRLSAARLREEADGNLRSQANLVAREVDAFVFRALESARTDGTIPSLAAFVNAPAEEQARQTAAMIDLLRSATVHDPLYMTSCALFDPAGRKLVDTAQTLAQVPESDEPWITQPLREGLPVLVPSFADPRRPVLWIGAPVRDRDHRIVGVVRQRYEMAALQQIVAEHSRPGPPGQFAALLGDTGYFLAHGRDTALVGQALPDALLDEIERRAGGYARAFKVALAWNDAGRKHAAPGEHAAFRALDHAPWIAVVVNDGAFHDQPEHALQGTMLTLGTLAVVLLVVTSVVAAQRLGRPITLLAEAAERLGDGRLERRTAPVLRARGEIGMLARTFDQMAERLHTTLATLEQRVRELREREQTLDSFIADSPVATVVSDRAFRTLRMNRKFTVLFGYTPEEIPDVRDWWPLAYPDPAYRAAVQAEWTARVDAARRAGTEITPMDAVVRCRDGSRRHIEFQGRPVGEVFISTFTDLTERENAERALRESEERFRLLVENSGELILLLNGAGAIIYASPNHLPITGRDPAQLRGTNPLAQVHPDDLPAVAEKLRARAAHAVFRYRFQDGSWHWLESGRRFFTVRDGEEHSMIVSRDITEGMQAEETRRRLEEQLRQAQKLEAIGTLAGGIAHDFNNILLGILGNTQLALEELPADHPARELLQESHLASLRARDLVARILTFSRRSETRLAPHALGPVVQEAVQLLRASLPAGIAIDLRLDSAARPVECDPTQIHQIVVNLGTNAGHAMRDRPGTLGVTFGPARLGPEDFAAHPELKPEHDVCLTVSDTGTGMDEATRRRLFEPFFTTKGVGEGTGLGLAVVHGILRSLGGVVLVESTPGRGSTFRIFLRGVDDAVAAPAAAPAREATGAGRRIAVVDDEEVVRRVCARALRQLDYEPTVFAGADDLLVELARTPGAFDAVLSDLTMPGRDGLDLAREVRRHRPELPVIVASGNATRVSAADLLAAGVTEVIEKPFSIDALGAALGRVLQGRRAE